MNAQTKVEAEPLAIWNALAKTDPAQTKQFKRAGGFSGTALKPIWVIKRLTEQFGAVGVGWGMGQPRFETVAGHNGEVLVYCTVECWHTQPDNTFVGVGGDKVVTYIKANPQYNRPERWENDDEAYKKAFTDAVGNAFKFVGVGADIHMGQFDDSKYVQQIAREFAEQGAARETKQESAVSSPPPKRPPQHSALKTRLRGFVHELNGCGDGDELSAFLATPDATKVIEETQEKLPHLWSGLDWPEGIERPEEFVPLAELIANRERECAAVSAQYLNA